MTRRIAVAPLGEICDVKGGLWAAKKGERARARVIRNTNFTKDCLLDLGDVAELDVESAQLAVRTLRRGDLILEKSGGGPKQAVGRVVLFDVDEQNYTYSNFTSRLRILDPERVDYQYLHRFLWYFYESGGTEGMQSNSTGIRNLSLASYKDVGVPIPSLRDQHRIVARLDELVRSTKEFEQSAESRRAAAATLFGAQLRTALSGGEDWRETVLADVTHFIGRGISPSYTESPGLVVLNQRCIRNHQVSFESARLHDSHAKSVKEERILQDGDVLINSTGVGTLGRVAPFRRMPGTEPCTVDSHVTVVRPNPEVFDPAFFGFLLISLQSRFEGLGQGSGGQTELGRALVAGARVRFPTDRSMQEEQAMALGRFREMVIQLEANVATQLQEIRSLRRLVLHESFEGLAHATE